ncbi:hypothetical protein ACFO24_08520, partial [Comamonas denitrificans]
MQKLSFKAKILLMLASALLALIVMATLALVQERKLIIEQRQTTLLTAVQAAQSIVLGYKAAADSGKMSQEDAQNAAIQALRLSRYSGAEVNRPGFPRHLGASGSDAAQTRQA